MVANDDFIELYLLRWLFKQIKEASEKPKDGNTDIKPLIFADLVVDVVKDRTVVLTALNFNRWLFEQIKEATEKPKDGKNDIKPVIIAHLVADIIKDRVVVAQYFDDMEERLEGIKRLSRGENKED